MNKEYVPHIIQEGARFHVLSYFGGDKGSFVRCSEPNCEYNKHYDEVFKLKEGDKK